MKFLRRAQVPEGETLSSFRNLLRAAAGGVAPETVAPAAVKTEATLGDDDGVEVSG